MLVGIVGAPNKGKSTLFSALTSIDVQIADYPFTTIKPNMGVAYVTKRCADTELHVKCNPKNSMCADGIRMIPVKLIDVAGLVEGAHSGRGMGNQFLSDIAAADALIIVADASGKTDTNGNPCSGCDPAKDVSVIIDEMVAWLAGIISSHSKELSRSKDGAKALAAVLAGLRITEAQISDSIAKCNLPSSGISWDESETLRFSRELLSRSKPFLVAANKSDVHGSASNTEKLKAAFGPERVIACSAAVELALRKAERQGIISYNAGSGTVKVTKAGIPREQADALNYMTKFVEEHGTGVQQIIDRIYFDILDNIVVYPVEDENRYTDSMGNVLPDAILLKRGSTALDLASAIHTDLANGMLYAIDARKKMRIAKDRVLNDNDVIKIVSSAKPK